MFLTSEVRERSETTKGLWECKPCNAHQVESMARRYKGELLQLSALDSDDMLMSTRQGAKTFTS